MSEQMTSRERIMAAINHEQTDRVPVDYWGVPEITAKLMKHFGTADLRGLYRAMGLDRIMGIHTPLRPDRESMWNVKMKSIPLPDGSGYYDEPVSYPIGNYETIGEIESNYSWPATDMFDYSTVREQCVRLRNEGYAVEGGYISLTYFYEMIRGTEQMLMDFAADEKLAEHIIYRINEFASAHTRRILEEADGLCDITQITDDFGAQNNLRVSEAMIDRYVGKYYKANCRMAHEFNVKVFHHDDGAVASLIPWLIRQGCDILNPIQWNTPGWDLNFIKKAYGGDLCFHGGIDNQYALPFGNADDVKAQVAACVDALYSDRTGYILAPCHNIQAITPIENILTMYDFAKSYSAI